MSYGAHILLNISPMKLSVKKKTPLDGDWEVIEGPF